MRARPFRTFAWLGALVVLSGCPASSPKLTKKLIVTPDTSDAQFAQQVKGQTELEVLDLRESKLTDAGLAHVAALANLKWLNLDGVGVTDSGLENLKNLSSLEKLVLSNTAVTDAGLIHLHGLANLESLDLDGTTVTDAGLAHLVSLSKLRALSLIDTAVTDGGLDHLAGLPGLESAALLGTEVTESGVASLKQALPDCVVIR